MQITATIIPIFLVIFVGWFARRKQFIPDAFLGPANRLVYYLAIPAMIFRAISRASFHEEFNVQVLFITLLCILAVFLCVWVLTVLTGIARPLRGTYIQCAFHGNLGYIGLAVVFYYLGESGLAKGGIFAGFIMILQNILAVITLQFHADKQADTGGAALENIRRIVGHPVILSALAGILVSLAGVRLPLIIDRSLVILSGMALPLALLLIGASLSFDLMRARIRTVSSVSLFKLAAMPGLGIFLFKLFDIPAADYLPAFILLAAPTATLTYVMAKEMKGDADFAVAAISGCTLLSAVSYTIWLNIV
ncbi:MAG: AEC family transporter [Desulfobacterales bacterium]|nr:AEC family transporter [Desulfobacterales bacterium]